PPRRRNDDVDPLVGERPLQQRLLPGLDSELAQRSELLLRRWRDQRARAAERPHHDHRDAELSRARQQPPLRLALARVERELDSVESLRLEGLGELVEGGLAVMRDPEPVDPSGVALLLEPW